MSKQERRVLVARSRSWRVTVTAAATVLSLSGTALAQETVIIGGSGQSSVEVNLETLRDLAGRQVERILRFPGEATDQTVVLRPPGGNATPAPTATRRPVLTAPTANARPSMPAPAAPAINAPAPPPLARPAAPVVRETAAAAPPRVTSAPMPAPPTPPTVARQIPPRDSAAPVRAVPRAPVTAQPLPTPPAARQQTAALPPAVLPNDGQALRLLFEGSSTQLSAAAQTELQQMAGVLNTNERRIQLKAFASGTSDRPSAARRESLSRALAVRSFLIENGVRSTRIDVRALGEPTDGGPSDRVDVILLTQ
ncbi:MAG: OmpA family protein [Proteobacteria bacterium]|nr:OmpA family protein [Pseudomonadota bacterium]